MSGIDKIIARLAEENEAECAAVLREAEAKAEAILADAGVQAQEKSAQILAGAQKQADETIRLAESAARMMSRQHALSEKVALLNDVLTRALAELEQLPDAEYFSVLKKLITENAQPGDGVLLIAESDAAKLPADFMNDVNHAIAPAGSLHLQSSDTLFAGKGVVLTYGNIEIDLTFAAIMSASEDILKETAREILFA